MTIFKKVRRWRDVNIPPRTKEEERWVAWKKVICWSAALYFLFSFSLSFLVLGYFSCPGDRFSRQLSTEQRVISRWAPERASRVEGESMKNKYPSFGESNEGREKVEVYRPGIGSQLRHITHFTFSFFLSIHSIMNSRSVGLSVGRSVMTNSTLWVLFGLWFGSSTNSESEQVRAERCLSSFTT